MPYAIHVPNTPLPGAREAYLDAWKVIDERDLRHPQGRRLHIAWLVGDVLNVVDVWDSLEQQQAFMRDLAPILDQFGMTLDGPPRTGEFIQIVEPPVRSAQA
jgi:hypothetical protein